MKEKLIEIEGQFEELTAKLSDPQVLADQAKYAQLARSRAELEPLALKIRELSEAEKSLEAAREMLDGEKDAEMQQYVHEEIRQLEGRLTAIEGELKEMMILKDPNDEKDIIMEIRAGTGGEEASLFAGDLYRMYVRFAEERRYKTEVMSSSPSDLNGFKEIIFEIRGRGAYSMLKYESGVHRVQRVPVTESGGRIHTSAATVAVLPVVEDVEVELKPQDIRIDIFRSSGPGGQSVNTTDSAVRVTHLPTGIAVSMQEERSQLQNRERALRVLRARLYEATMKQQHDAQAQARKSMVGSGDRSERIRTYNFPQNRVTDHRIGVTLHDLGGILEGHLDKLIESLTVADRAERLKEVV